MRTLFGLTREDWAWLLFMAAIVLILSLHTASAIGATFPYANFDGYKTTLVLVNPGSVAVPVPEINHAFAVQPLEARRLDGYPGSGGGTFDLPIPAGLDAYVEIEHPEPVDAARPRPVRLGDATGLVMRVSDIGAATELALWLDAKTGDGWATYVFIHATAATTLQLVAWNGDGAIVGSADLLLRAGDVAIPEVPASAVAFQVTYYHGIGEESVPRAPFRAFAFLTHRATGNMIPLTRY